VPVVRAGPSGGRQAQGVKRDGGAVGTPVPAVSGADQPQNRKQEAGNNEPSLFTWAGTAYGNVKRDREAEEDKGRGASRSPLRAACSLARAWPCSWCPLRSALPNDSGQGFPCCMQAGPAAVTGRKRPVGDPFRRPYSGTGLRVPYPGT